jgi:hypothetical protein
MDEGEKNFREGLNTYYNLKNEYDTNFENQKIKLIKTAGLSWKEKQKEFQKIKRKCVNCKRPVGTIFKTTIVNPNDFNNERHLIAMCGDRGDPCPLNVDINLSYIVNLNEFIEQQKRKIEKDKNEIILDKNNLLFGYIDSNEAVENFDTIKDILKSELDTYEISLDQINKVIDDSEKNTKLKNLENEFYANVSSLKLLLSEFDKSSDTQYVLDAVELYKDQIVPKLKEIMKTKYTYSVVEYNEDDNTYHLKQEKYTINELEFDMGENEYGVLKMEIGMNEIKRTQTENSNKTLTQSNKNIIIRDEDEDEEPIEYGEY